MPSKIALATALALTVANNLRTQIKANRTTRALLQENDNLEAHTIEIAEHFQECMSSAQGQIKYLCSLLVENEIPVSEFDLIALNYYN